MIGGQAEWHSSLTGPILQAVNCAGSEVLSHANSETLLDADFEVLSHAESVILSHADSEVLLHAHCGSNVSLLIVNHDNFLLGLHSVCASACYR